MKWTRKLSLIAALNLFLFGVTPLLHCEPAPQKEAAPQDATPARETPPSPEPRPTSPDLPQANTPYSPPQSSLPKDSFELKTSGFALKPSPQERKICFVFDAPSSDDRLLHRFEPLVQKGEVVKRMVLSVFYGDKQDPRDCTDDDPSKIQVDDVFFWVPGVPAFQFPPKSGFFLQGKRRLRLMVHAHNAGSSDVQLQSGLKVYHLPQGGKTYLLWSHNNPKAMEIPPGKTAEQGAICHAKEGFSMLAGIPLMGGIGTRFVSEVIHADGTRDELIYLENWSPQKHWKLFAFPFTLAKGDVLSTTCNWRNTRQHAVQSGWRSSDETCQLLVYIDAAQADTKALCDDKAGPAYTPPPIGYKPGQCAPKDGLPSAKDVPIKTTLGSELDVNYGYKGGEWKEGTWELSKGAVVFNSALLGNLLLKEYTMAAGQLRTGGGTFILDFKLQAIIKTGGRTIAYPFPVSVSGDFKKGAAQGQFSVDVKCGDFDHKELSYQLDDDTFKFAGIVTVNSQAGPIQYALQLEFSKKK